MCLVGIDGSGKSTLAKALAAAAQENGVRCRYVYSGSASSFTIFRPMEGLAKALVFVDREDDPIQAVHRVKEGLEIGPEKKFCPTPGQMSCKGFMASMNAWSLGSRQPPLNHQG